MNDDDFKTIKIPHEKKYTNRERTNGALALGLASLSTVADDWKKLTIGLITVLVVVGLFMMVDKYFTEPPEGWK